ncbi:MAG: hypothetical protein HYY09_05260 [Firmicutes bacterium]|nr:hypothetical protein [Bacillota bacterium]
MRRKTVIGLLISAAITTALIITMNTTDPGRADPTERSPALQPAGGYPAGAGEIPSAPPAGEHLAGDMLSSPPGGEYAGIVYQGYLLKTLWENEWGWNIPLLAKELDMTFNVLEPEEDPRFIDSLVPVDFALERGGVKLTFKGDVERLSDPRYLSIPETAGLSYSAFKDSRVVEMKKDPLTYRTAGPYGDLNELLDMLEVSYFQDGPTIYLDARGKTPILGKKLAQASVGIGEGLHQLSLELLYDYKGENNPGYKRIRLLVSGAGGDRELTVFDERNPGSSMYYRDGSIERISYQGDELVQLNLGMDTVVFLHRAGELIKIFSPEDYRRFLGGNLVLETDQVGNAVFVDRFNGFQKALGPVGSPPNSSYDLHVISFGRITEDIPSRKLKLIADAGAVHEGRHLFLVQIEFVYEQDRQGSPGFTPVRIHATDWAKFDQDKRDGKPIRSMEEYRLFDYEISDEAKVRSLVEAFGRKLQAVPLLAPKGILDRSMQENYGNLVSPELLGQWQDDPLNAPGKTTSSPWPDRIEILQIKKSSGDAYEVSGEIIEITSTEQASGGVAARRPITLLVDKIETRRLIVAATLGAYAESGSVVYRNTRYGFSFSLPGKWKDHSIITSGWEGIALTGSKTGEAVETGPTISIRHPDWTSRNPRQDIPIMVFTLTQWNSLQRGEVSVGAAPIGPSELARNARYVFALPARYNYAFPTGYEEVEIILQGNPLRPID